MAELKTRKNEGDVTAFLDSVEDDKKRADSYKVLGLMKKVTGETPKMWGSSIIGFGDYRYKYASGREGDWFLTGFSPRKQAITLYIMNYLENYEDLLKDLGKFKTGKGCLYIRKLEDVDMKVLEKLIRTSVKQLPQRK